MAALVSTLPWAKPAAAQCGPGSGTDNTECGTGALASNTIGSDDSAFGINALYSNTTGFNNTASGEYAL
jgi:hypothetical protein